MADNTDITPKERCKLCCKYHWRGFVLILVPLIFLPLLFVEPVKAMRCAYILCVMGTYWVTEAIPIYITALVPIIAMPLMGIMSSNETCMQYMKDVVMFFFVSMIIALAVEYSKLHTRLALAVISVVGCSPRRLHLSMMVVTFFISFWITNSAATAMVCPIAKAILGQLDEQGLIKFNKDKKPTNENEPPYPSNITLSFFLGIAYSASIGGCATLIGTGTNLAVKGLYDTRFPQSSQLSFNNFIFFNLPPVLIVFILTYFWLEVLLMGLFRPNSITAQELKIGADGKKAAMDLIKQKRTELGPMSLVEIFTGIYFALMVISLFLLKPDVFPGFSDIVNEKKVKNSVPTILIAFLMFVTPATFAFCHYFGCKQPENDKPTNTIMNWEYIQKNLPWGIILLLGGGSALSKGIKESNLAIFLGNHMKMLTHLPHFVIQFCCIVSGIIFTAFSSNLAIASILEPILFEVAVTAEVHPLYLALPAGMACSLAFHLPVSTPPNAIVAGFVNIRTKDMAIAGIGPTLISLFVYFAFSQVWGPIVFNDFDVFPAWAKIQKLSDYENFRF